jgi:hypothetical protein
MEEGTMEGMLERRHAPVPAEMVEYLKANPSAGTVAGPDGVHLHVHHHYPAPAPAPAPAATEKTVAEKVVPWLLTLLLGCIVVTLCVAVLAVAGAIVAAVLLAVVVVGLVALFVIRQFTASVEAQARADEAKAKAAAKVNRRKR